MVNISRRKRTLVIAALSIAVAGVIYFTGSNQRTSSTSLRRRLLFSLSDFTDPKSVTLRSDAPNESSINHEGFQHPTSSRNNCQIIYITGVEGATHHGFIPIIETLAKHQIDTQTGLAYKVDASPSPLKAGLFGWFKGKYVQRKWGFTDTPNVDDPALVQSVVRESCPDDGHKHVLIEWASFPSGHEDDRRSYRFHRQHNWLTMTPEEIANNPEALEHPTDMNAFVKAYSPYVDIKFIVLHRPFLETIASHPSWDGGPIVHSNIIRGFMLILRRFLDQHLYDVVSGQRIWSLVCVANIMAKNYNNEHDVTVARRHVVAYLTKFLGWENGDCDHCWDTWHESNKDPEAVLGKNYETLREHTTFLEGVWPPPGEPGIVEQQCGI